MNRLEGAAAILASDVFCLYDVPDGAVAALRGLSLSVDPSERLLVHGPNGSGKTTLLRVLAGEQPISAGMVHVAGVDMTGCDERTATLVRRRVLGILDQHPARTLRPELTVLANVALQCRLSGASRTNAENAARETLARLGLSELQTRSPATLSGGEAQRVAVCAAIAHGPKVVLADEPTGELDARTAGEVYDLLDEAVRSIGATLVLVSHDPAAARTVDRVVRIRDGRLSEEWAPGAAHDESLVVDDRGWLRLPEPLRAQAGAQRRVNASLSGETIVLRGGDPPEAAPVAHRPAAATGQRNTLVRGRGIVARRGERLVLDGIDVEVATGELVVIDGRSGSGKSTLLAALLGLIDADGGAVDLLGTDLHLLRRAERARLRRSGVGVAGQRVALIEALTVTENVRLGPSGRIEDDTTAARVENVLEGLGLSGLRTRPVRMLSGGERQRVALARSLLSGARLVVCDEPTSQQDEAHAERVVSVLRQATGQGVGVLAATHDPVLRSAADRMLSLG